jgi:hypothetical protein
MCVACFEGDPTRRAHLGQARWAEAGYDRMEAARTVPRARRVPGRQTAAGRRRYPCRTHRART